MDGAQQGNDEQTRLWNGPAGRAWVDAQALLDQMFKPFEDLLIKAAAAGPAKRVLDIGCGTGATTLAVAGLLGAKGDCVGMDISAAMLARARTRAEQAGSKARFICADAQRYAFEPASFDLIISRLGVMFFDDPVRAFTNLRLAARTGGRLRLIAWRGAAENPFMTTAERATAPLLPNLPPRRPGAPGQFAFADRRHVERILAESGWTDVDIEPIDIPCSIPEAQLVTYLTRLGPVGLILQDADERTRAQVIETVRKAFTPYAQGKEVRFTAACWMIGARALSAAAS